MFVSRDQQWNLYAAGRFEESEAEYQRSQTLDGDHGQADIVALLRGLALSDGDPQELRELFQRLFPVQKLQPQWEHDFGAAIPNRREMLAVLRKATDAGEAIAPQFADALGDRDLALSALRSGLKLNRGKSGA
jgi:tetratricopeptide (TPR) repeat protein